MSLTQASFVAVNQHTGKLQSCKLESTNLHKYEYKNGVLTKNQSNTKLQSRERPVIQSVEARSKKNIRKTHAAVNMLLATEQAIG